MWNHGAAITQCHFVVLAALLLWQLSLAADDSGFPGEVQAIQEEYLHRSWTMENGLPDNHVTAILQTRDGYLWAATPWGLARFDGVHFTVFNRANTPAMESERCLSLIEDQSCNLWVITERALLVRSAAGFKKYHINGQSRVCSFIPDATNGIWTSSSLGNILFHCQVDGRYAAYPLPAKVEGIISSIYRRGDGSTWIGNGVGGFWLDPSFQRALPLRGKPAQNHYYWHDALFLSGGSAYDLVYSVKEGRGRLYRIDGGSWDLCLTNWFSNMTRPVFLAKDRQQNLWMPLNQGGLLRWTPQQATRFKVPLASINDSVFCMHEDREGNLWYGAVYGGLHRLQPRRLHMLSTLERLAGPTAECLLEASDGSLWIGTDHGLLHLNQDRCVLYTEADGLSRRVIRSLAMDRSGRLWVGTLSGLNYFQEGQFLTHHFPGDWEEGKVRALLASRDGGLWVGTVRGLNRIYQGRQTKLTTAQGLSHDEVLSLWEDPAGDLWVGTAGGGLNRLSWPAHLPASRPHSETEHPPPVISVLSVTNGLSDDYVRAIAQDAEGVLWIGTDNGLNRYQDGRCFIFNQSHGLPRNQINMLLADEAGFLWMGGERGLCRVARAAMQEVVDGKQTRVSAIEYDQSDGLSSLDISGKFSQPASCRTQDGRLWIGTGEGVAIFDPRGLPDLTNPPPVVIEQIRANGHIQYDNGLLPTNRFLPSSDSSLTLAPGSGRILEFQYTANTFMGAEKTRFQYRLVGLDRNWIEAGLSRRAYYANVSPGAYRFEVRAASKHGVWSERGASMRLILQPHFYQTWWFYLAGGASIAGLLYQGIAWRLKELRKIERLERHIALEDQRKRIARDIHDELGSSLTQIAQLSEDTLNQASPSATPIRRIASLAEEAVSNIGEIVWANNPRYDTLEDLLAFLREYTANYLDSVSLEKQLSFPETIPAWMVPGPFRRHLLAMVKEILSNIVKHSGATAVEITVLLKDNSLTLIIRDNGCGLVLQDKGRFSNGLTNIEERLAELKGAWEVDGQPQRGTLIRVEVPLPARSVAS